MALFTAQLHPGRALGVLAEPQRFPKLELIYSADRPVMEPVCVDLPNNGIRLRFDGPEQRLRLIEVLDFAKSHITFQDRDLPKLPAGTPAAGESEKRERLPGPALRQIYNLLGPTYAGEFIPPTEGQNDVGTYVLSYPGVAFNFPLALAAYDPRKDVIALFAASPNQPAASMAVYSGDSWTSAQTTLFTETLPSLQIMAKSKDSYPDEVSLARLFGGGKIDLLRKWTNNAFRVQLGETTPQDLVTELGPPSAIYRRSDQKLGIHKLRAAGTAQGRPNVAELVRPDDLTDTDQSSMYAGSDDSDEEKAREKQALRGPRGDCFYNYFHLGFDVLFSTAVEPSAAPPGSVEASSDGGNGFKSYHPDRLVATKFVLHGNIPGSYEFNRHRRCRWEVAYLNEQDQEGPVHSETDFEEIERRLTEKWQGKLSAGQASPRQRGMVLSRGWGDSPGSSCELLGGWEDGGGRKTEAHVDSATTLYGFPGLVFEVLKNGYVSTVTVF